MGLKEDKTITDIVQAVKESDAKKTKGYDTQATVTRVEDGKAWVNIPGGVPETPAELTINAQPGDIVMVRVAGGRAFLLGNATNPPTDDATAREALSNAADALQSAVNAKRAADSAEASAETAKAAAEDAVETAESVHDIAVQAQTDAATAKASAENANEYAARALGNLSTVQSVTETLNWITQHGTMTRTTDTALDPTHVYFVQDNNGDYVVGNVHYSVVTEPKLADISTYYELSIDESLNNYVATHLALTDEGLYVMADDSEWKLLIKPDGVYVVDPQGNYASQFKNFAQLGLSTGAHSIIDENGQRFYASNGRTLLANIGYGATQEAGQKNPYYTFGFRTPSSAIGSYSVAEGGGVTASGTASHAEGNITVASEACAHAEGLQTTASGTASHAEGLQTTASGQSSHAQNEGTIAAKDNQTAIGKWNIEDTETTASKQKAFIIGNGTSNASRSNAFSVDWNGNVEASGDIEDGSGNVLRDKADSSDLADYLPLTGGTLTGELDGTNATMSGDITSKTAKLDISNYTTAGNVDKTIYDALNSLGWLSDCVES